MSDRLTKTIGKASRQTRVRAGIHGTAERPRLSISISNQHVSAQIINDDEHNTIVSASTIGKKLTGTMTERATAVGVEVAKAAKIKNINKVVFDRGARKYHGRVKALADAARENGLEF